MKRERRASTASAAAITGADGDSGDMVSPKGASSLMQFTFDNLRFSDVLERAECSLKTVDEVIDFLRGRAAAEDKYSRAVRELGTVNTSLLSNLGGLWGANKTAGTSAMEDNSTLQTALDGARGTMVKVADLRAQQAARLDSLAARLADLRQRQHTQQKS